MDNQISTFRIAILLNDAVYIHEAYRSTLCDDMGHKDKSECVMDTEVMDSVAHDG